MTIRELREMLFNVENQELTVKELRAILFEVEEQDKELKAFDMIWLTRNNKSVKEEQ
jgi:hypothetical protein